MIFLDWEINFAESEGKPRTLGFYSDRFEVEMILLELYRVSEHDSMRTVVVEKNMKELSYSDTSGIKAIEIKYYIIPFRKIVRRLLANRENIN